jgi:hypothetical protein
LNHSAYLPFIKREIPVYCIETTKTILQALSDVRRTNLEFDVSGLNFETFRTDKKITLITLRLNQYTLIIQFQEHTGLLFTLRDFQLSIRVILETTVQSRK